MSLSNKPFKTYTICVYCILLLSRVSLWAWLSLGSQGLSQPHAVFCVSLCVSVCPYGCMCLYVLVAMCACVSLCVCLCVPVSVCPYGYACLYVLVAMCLCVLVAMCVCVSLWMCVCLCMCVCVSACTQFCVCMCLYVCSNCTEQHLPFHNKKRYRSSLCPLRHSWGQTTVVTELGPPGNKAG